MNPFPLILSSPSGGGKTAITRELLALRRDVGYSVSCTTRMPRTGEVDGTDYYFLGQGEFASRRERGEFAESAEVHGKMYGTLRREVERVLESGKHVVMDIDVQGASQFVSAFPMSVLVFILPPSAEVLIARLTARKTEDRSSLVRRMQSALEELRAVAQYQYVVTNDRLDHAVTQVSGIVDAEAARRERALDLDERVGALVGELEREIGRDP